ncbi:MAG: hypothetical protein U9Q03_04195 [Patescibacteria group bacterium]|nr:hypothetical protein [Patescibacteria group bacterium]
MFNPIELREFEKRTGNRRLDYHNLWDSADRIVSLRDITDTYVVADMPLSYLGRILKNVTLVGNPRVYPYEDKDIQTLRVDPGGVRIGQTFLERRKILALMEEFPNVFEEFTTTRGIAKLNAKIVLGRTADDSIAIAHYLPPIVEQHGCRMILLDGIHRFFLMLRSGTTIETVVVYGIERPFPASVQKWDSIRMVETKPPKDERFFDLKPGLFRDLKSVGVDG